MSIGNNNSDGQFNGMGLSGGILLAILILLLVFGSTNIDELTDSPDFVSP